MKKYLSLGMKILLLPTAIIIVILGWIIVYGTLSDYQPKNKEAIHIHGQGYKDKICKNNITLLSWNIGYCGLGKEMDFFYEGGKKVRPSSELYQTYLNGVYNFFSQYDTVDFILLQEVDKQARRSFFTNQREILSQQLLNHESVYAKNFDVKFIPVPLYKPTGEVTSGMMTFSVYQFLEADRYALPSGYFWPKSIFHLDRCLIYSKFSLKNGNNLILINIHNSAFEDADEMRESEIIIIKALVLDEYLKGNYVIAGGDWNQNPPGFDPDIISKNEIVYRINQPIDSALLPNGWKWAYDPYRPTNRDVSKPYVQGKTNTTILDYFVTSPNIEIVTANTIQTGFEFSDHQPVYLKVHLIEKKPLSSNHKINPQ